MGSARYSLKYNTALCTHCTMYVFIRATHLHLGILTNSFYIKSRRSLSLSGNACLSWFRVKAVTAIARTVRVNVSMLPVCVHVCVCACVYIYVCSAGCEIKFVRL